MVEQRPATVVKFKVPQIIPNQLVNVSADFDIL